MWKWLVTLLMAAIPATARLPLEDPEALYLMWREDQRVVDGVVLTLLDDARDDVRARAALAVGRVGRVEDVAKVARLLRDPSPEVRRVAAFALGEIADSTSAPPIEARLAAGEPVASVRGALVEALGKIRAGSESCRRALDDPDPAVRARALIAAWQIPVPDVTTRVIDCSRSDHPRERWAASYCLMRLQGAPASGRTPIAEAPPLAEGDADAARRRLLELLRDDDPEIRLAAARGLRPADDSETTDALLAAAFDPDWRVRVEVVRALGTGARSLRVADLTGLLDDEHVLVGHTAFEQLARLGSDAEAMPHLLGGVQSPNPRRVEIAFRALVTRWRADSTRAENAGRLAQIERLAHYVLGRGEWSVQALAVDALPLLAPDPAARDVVLDAVLDSDDRVVKLAAAAWLDAAATTGEGSLADRLSPAIAALITRSDPMVHLMTWASAAEMITGDSTATEADRARADAWLSDAYARWSGPVGADVRQAVVEAFAEVGDRPAATAILTRALRDENHIVRRAAATALDRPIDAAPVVPVDVLSSPLDYTHIARWAEGEHWAVFHTAAGRMVARLHSLDSPLTTWNFARLANGGFYDAGAWHRVVPDFVLQDGCPRTDGWGGPDWQIRCEINEHPYDAGALGMALAGKDTGGSQYFFTHSAQPHLDGGYTVFGQLDPADRAVANRVDQRDVIHWVRVVDAHPTEWSVAP